VSACGLNGALASILVGGAIFVISFFHQATTASNQSQTLLRSQNTVQFLVTAGLAIVFVGASVTPYLAVQARTQRSRIPAVEHRTFDGKAGSGLREAKPGYLQSAGLVLRSALADNPQRGSGRACRSWSSHRPYPVFKLYLEKKTQRMIRTELVGKKSNRNSTMIVADDSYSGLILRPEIKRDITIEAPLARRRVFDGDQTTGSQFRSQSVLWSILVLQSLG